MKVSQSAPEHGLRKQVCKEAKNDKGTPDECVYMDKVLPAVTVAASSTRERQWIRDKFDIDPTDRQAFIKATILQWAARDTMDPALPLSRLLLTNTAAGFHVPPSWDPDRTLPSEFKI
ncbi:DNA helicase, ATP-dependent, RecQ type [Metarhizium brunneum]